MVLPALLDPFAKGAAPAVMTRLALDWMIPPTFIDPLLEEVADGRYGREFPLGHFVEVMADVACGFRSSPRSALLKRQFDRIASLSAFYAKRNRMEPVVSAAIVAQAADRARQLIEAVGSLPEPLAGYSARIRGGRSWKAARPGRWRNC